MLDARRPLLALGLAALAGGAWAQEAFIQLEAKRSREEAEVAAAIHAARVEDVRAYAAAGGWYVVAVGPYAEGVARERLDALRGRRLVPLDAFLTEGDLYRGRLTVPEAADESPTPTAAVEPTAAAVDRALDETPRQAREGERALDRGAREAVQRALDWAGFYDGPIDAAFGRGTRAAMAGWQRARGLDPTGVLTTAQRRALIGEYEAVLDGLGMAMVRDEPAGIALEVPSAVLRHEGRETPFSRYVSPEGEVAELVLISREGDRATLAGLFEVVQTLEIVPRGGRNEIEGDIFRIRGRDGQRQVRGFARHEDGRIKGMILAWPAEDDEARFRRLWDRMRGSFRTTEAVLGPDQATPAPEQRLDRLAGLAIREPTLARTGFFVDGEGAVLTTAEITSGQCGSILIDDVHEARVAWTDGRVALLRPEAPLAPPRVASLSLEPPRLGEDVAVAGFPFGGALGLASVTYGTLEDLRGLAGDEELDRYDLRFEPGDAGGPVLGPDGTVAGLLLSGDGGEAGEARTLPERVAFGVDAERIRAVLEELDVAPPPAPAAGEPTPERLAREGAEIAVLVTCHP